LALGAKPQGAYLKTGFQRSQVEKLLMRGPSGLCLVPIFAICAHVCLWEYFSWDCSCLFWG
jgi:hypothetical protein